MRLRFLLLALMTMIFFLAACQGPPPTQIVLVVTATPNPDDTAISQDAPVSATATIEQVVETEEPTITPTPTPTLTPTPDPFPEPIMMDVYVAEQRYQNGRMFWLQSTDQIIVMVEQGENGGVWAAYEDTFEDGEIEFDPDIITPDENLMQPVRGFGKLWRENVEVRESLGWALEAELGHTTTYEYHAGGTVNEQNEYVPGPGYHVLVSLFGDVYRLNEGDWTWEKLEG